MQTQATTCRFTLKDVTIVTVETLVLVFIAQLILAYIAPKNIFGTFFANGAHTSIATTLLYVLQTCLFLFPLTLHVVKKYRASLLEFGFKKVALKTTITLVLKAFGIVFLFGFFISYIQLQFGIELFGFGPQESHIPLFGTSTADIILAIVVVGVIAPFVEELIFRGFLLQTLLKYVPAWSASLIVALIFGLIHFEFQSAGILIFLGLILNWLYIKSNSTIPGIAFHVVNNLLAFWLEFLR